LIGLAVLMPSEHVDLDLVVTEGKAVEIADSNKRTDPDAITRRRPREYSLLKGVYTEAVENDYLNFGFRNQKTCIQLNSLK